MARPMLDQPNSIIFSDINPDVLLDSSFELVYNEEAINKSLETIFTTPLNSRPFRRNFGCRLNHFLFDPIDSITANSIGLEFREAALRWEKRIDNIEILVLPDLLNQHYYVEISYRIPALGNKMVAYKFNLAAGR